MSAREASDIMISGYFGLNSYLALGSPADLAGFSGAEFGGSRLLSPAASSAEDRYRRAWTRIEGAGDVDTGLGRQSLWKCFLNADGYAGGAAQDVSPLVASRQSYPDKAGTICLRDVNDGYLQAALDDPCLITTESAAGPWPRVKMPQPQSEFLLYMRRVFDADGGDLLAEHQIAPGA